MLNEGWVTTNYVFDQVDYPESNEVSIYFVLNDKPILKSYPDYWSEHLTVIGPKKIGKLIEKEVRRIFKFKVKETYFYYGEDDHDIVASFSYRGMSPDSVNFKKFEAQLKKVKIPAKVRVRKG